MSRVELLLVPWRCYLPLCLWSFSNFALPYNTCWFFIIWHFLRLLIFNTGVLLGNFQSSLGLGPPAFHVPSGLCEIIFLVIIIWCFLITWPSHSNLHRKSCKRYLLCTQLHNKSYVKEGLCLWQMTFSWQLWM
jgi:hypothetical protein